MTAVAVCGMVAIGGLLGGCGTSSPDSSSSAFAPSALAADDDLGACSPHYVEGITARQIAASLSSLYECIPSRDRPASLVDFNRLVMQYVLGRDELAARRFTNASTSIVTLWRDLNEGWGVPRDPDVSQRLTVACKDLGAPPGGGTNPSIEVSETLTTGGHANTEYARYLLVPTTPRVAGFGVSGFGRGDRRIWTLLYEGEIGETPGAHPTRGSCDWPLRRAGFAHDSLDLTIR